MDVEQLSLKIYVQKNVRKSANVLLHPFCSVFMVSNVLLLELCGKSNFRCELKLSTVPIFASVEENMKLGLMEIIFSRVYCAIKNGLRTKVTSNYHMWHKQEIKVPFVSKRQSFCSKLRIYLGFCSGVFIIIIWQVERN